MMLPSKRRRSDVGNCNDRLRQALVAGATAIASGTIASRAIASGAIAFGTIAGLQKAHYGLTYGTTFPGSADAPKNGPGYADIARAYGAEGHRLGAADELLPALEAAIASGKPTVLDVPMINNPTPTTGHWNILDIYSPDKQVSHVAT